MWRNSLRDLSWRRRRFAVAVAGAALVFASTLVMVGLTDSFHAEVRDTLRAVGADGWVVKSGFGGPFTSFRLLPQSTEQDIAKLPGVQKASGLVMVRQTARGTGRVYDINLIGYELGAMGSPRVAKGRTIQGPGEVVADDAMHVPVGGTVHISGLSYKVVGTSDGLTLFAGAPNVYMNLTDVQNLLFFGQRMVGVVLTRGFPTSTPAGYRVLTTAGIEADTNRPLGRATAALAFAQRILWIVAAFVIGAVVYTSALERGRDFAVFKATGVSSRYVLMGLAVQAIVLSLIAAVVGIGVSRILIPLFPMHVVFPTLALPWLGVEAVAVGVISSLFGARRALSADPALAFGGP